jgi:hypothetical protein
MMSTAAEAKTSVEKVLLYWTAGCRPSKKS